MAEIPPSNLLQMWAVVGELRTQIRELQVQVSEIHSQLHRCNNVLQHLGMRQELDANRGGSYVGQVLPGQSKVLQPQTPGTVRGNPLGDLRD
jgi:hypothetical protein